MWLPSVQSGEAMSLECQCRGDLALRHRTCAEKWSRVKVGPGGALMSPARHQVPQALHADGDMQLARHDRTGKPLASQGSLPCR